MDAEEDSHVEENVSLETRRKVGLRVKVLRELTGMSQAALGEAAGVGGQTISNIERAHKGTTLPRLEVIARALGCALSDIFDFDQLPPNDKAKRRSLRKLHTLVRDQDPAIIDLVTAQTRVLLRHLSKRG